MTHLRLLKVYAALLHLTVRLQISVSGLTTEIPLPCKAHHTTYVSCNWLLKVPETWPSWITCLDLSNNRISSLKPRGFAKLGNLRELRLDDNLIDTLGSQSFDGLDQLVTLLLNYSGILTVEGKPFSALHNLQTLDLSFNDLEVIQNHFFFGLSKLVSLNLKHNKIHSVFETSFSGLTKLSVLNLRNNEISTLPNDIFDDLLRLRVLNLGYNHLTCIDITNLNELVGVKTIIVDGLNFSNCNLASFVHIPTVEIFSVRGSEVSDHLLKKLRLPNNHVRHVDLSENMIESAESGILLNMTHVVSLDLSRNPLFPEPLERLLHSLENSSISVLKLQELGTRVEHFSELRPTTFRPLSRTKIEELDVSENNITKIPGKSFIGLHHLKYLCLSNSKIGTLFPTTFHDLNNLTKLKLDHNQLSNIEEIKEALKHLKSLKYLELGYNKLTEISSFAFVGVPNLVKLVLENNEISNIHRDSFGGLSNVHELDLTKNYILDIPNDTFSALPSLRILKLRLNALLSLKETHRPFRYLKNLTDLSISYSKPAAVNLHDVRTIKTLEIGNDYYLPWKTHEVDAGIANFTRLEILDIQRGRLIALPQMIPLKILRITDVNGPETDLDFADFAKHPLLEEIAVKSSNINITYGAPTIVKLPRLKTLILNQLQMTTFDTKILKTAPNLETLSFTDSPLDCSCTIADFVDWMRTDRKVRMDHLQGMVCETPLKRQGYFLFDVDFGNECHTAIIIAISLTCVTIVIVLSTILLVRFRWHLRHAIFFIKLKCGGYQLAVNDDSDDEPDNKYDAFVVYNEHDRDWVMGQLRPNLEDGDPPDFRLCLHERDFVPGNDIFENILDSIEKSHKTLLILSSHFAESEWCYFEMRMAQNHLFDGKRDVIVMILLEEIPDDKMPRVLRNILLTKRYLKWPNNRVGRRIFWQKLRLELKSENRVNRVANI